MQRAIPDVEPMQGSGLFPQGLVVDGPLLGIFDGSAEGDTEGADDGMDVEGVADGAEEGLGVTGQVPQVFPGRFKKSGTLCDPTQRSKTFPPRPTIHILRLSGSEQLVALATSSQMYLVGLFEGAADGSTDSQCPQVAPSKEIRNPATFSRATHSSTSLFPTG